ncbi:MAG TPA: hypothetical protein VN493_13965, partial [Thermoanaerobaculia bacterium]|nr:hypothetical protein [Thermoanaerobaculia bacterium]
MLLDQERPDHLEAADGGSLLVDVLCDLFPGQETLLFHLMVCPTCRGRATSTLLARHGMTLVLPVGLLGELLAGSCRPPEPRPDLADALLAELLTHPLEHHFELVEEPRFHDAALVELLAERSRHEQPRDLELSEHLASLAGKLALQTVPGVEDRERVLVRSAALMANARRLGGRPEQAERVLAGATVYSVPLAEQALFLRVKGLVSWELGRPDEGAHHLEEAVRLFSEARAV